MIVLKFKIYNLYILYYRYIIWILNELEIFFYKFQYDLNLYSTFKSFFINK